MTPPLPQWIVTTAPDQPVAELVPSLAGAGFSVEQVLDEIGCVIGRCSPAQAEALRGMAGVLDVSPGADIDIGPPDPPITW
jgi:CBS-domain-containing membrane protein